MVFFNIIGINSKGFMTYEYMYRSGLVVYVLQRARQFLNSVNCSTRFSVLINHLYFFKKISNLNFILVYEEQ